MATRILYGIQFFEIFWKKKKKNHDLRIISVKFDWNLIVSLEEEDFFVNVNGRRDVRQIDRNSLPLRAQVSQKT